MRGRPSRQTHVIQVTKNDVSEVSEVWQFTNSQGIQADPSANASGWHLPPFVRSLQLTFHGFCGSLDLAPS